MDFLSCFLSIYLCVRSRVLNVLVYMKEMIGCVLDVYYLWLIHLQFHCFVFLGVLELCILLIVGSCVEIMLQFEVC